MDFKTNKKLRSFILFLLFGTVFCYASIDVTLESRLESDLSVTESVNLTFSENNRSSITLTLPEGAAEPEINGKTAFLTDGSISVPLSCSDCAIRMTYRLDNVVKKTASGEFLFTRTLTLPKIPDRLSYSVVLPAGFTIGRESTNDPAMVPLPTKVETDGRRMILVWKEDIPALPKIYQVRFHSHESGSQDFLAELSETETWAFFIVGLILGILVGLSINRLFPSKKIVEMKVVPSSLFSPDEKEVLSLLKKGKLSQKELAKQLEWSKSKASGVLTGLEYKKIIRREKIGRNYNLELIASLSDI
ncbi:MAG: hypothetical protein HGA85_03585 [Nanoarchaeota archaeon]|nr:hypothetical protein [Nanoarchaeota archaeon]